MMIKAAIIGASGYSGAELVKLLAGHPQVNLTAITSRSRVGEPICSLYPNLTGLIDIDFSEYSADLAIDNDIIFLALPHGKAMELAPELFEVGKAGIIDISGDFRLPAKDYEHWYKRPHTAAGLINRAVYGLSELNKTAVANASLVANPGCYPTGVVLALAPLSATDIIGNMIVADCVSGISGAGRTLSEPVHFCRADENISAYKIGGIHQHVPEIERAISLFSQRSITVIFNPHLGPFARGIYSTLTVAATRKVSLREVRKLYTEFYSESRFVKVLAAGDYPQLKAVSGSNFCHLGLAVDERTGTIIVLSAIDNLVKGAAGQAVQNMNLMFGLDETTGLKTAGLYP